ncbi:MAG TPA: MarR family winged helix-turn-helix transcriptional regulator [Virgibacillus sp.]|nr:MarR family winged helix-turn-helix transcriptional regulator [Virgibacillus sp.]
MDKKIEEIKHFNRFYLRMMGLFSQYSDKSSYSSTEAMILYEISSKEDCTASYLANHYGFDKGYISRIINNFTNQGLIERRPSKKDRRVQFLKLTEKGEEVLGVLSKEANAHVKEMIKNIDNDELSELIHSMQRIKQLLSNNHV